MTSLLIKFGAAATALLATGGLAVLSLSAAANADTPVYEMSIQSPATLISHGAALTVPVIVNCPADSLGDLNISVQQSIGKRIASGSGEVQINCTGSAQAVVLTVPSRTVAFSKRGDAVAFGGVFGCAADGCGQASDSRTISIR